MTNVYLYVMSFSLIVNFGLILFLKFTGIGRDCWERWIWKRKFRNGNYAYSLMLTNSGKLEEVFEPIDKGLFKYESAGYVRNPKMTVHYKGLPVHFHREGYVEPIDPYNFYEEEVQTLSVQELDNIMSANENFNFLEWFENNKIIILGTILLLLVAGFASAYFGYNAYELLRDASVQASTVVSR